MNKITPISFTNLYYTNNTNIIENNDDNSNILKPNKPISIKDISNIYTRNRLLINEYLTGNSSNITIPSNYKYVSSQKFFDEKLAEEESNNKHLKNGDISIIENEEEEYNNHTISNENTYNRISKVFAPLGDNTKKLCISYDKNNNILSTMHMEDIENGLPSTYLKKIYNPQNGKVESIEIYKKNKFSLCVHKTEITNISNPKILEIGILEKINFENKYKTELLFCQNGQIIDFKKEKL